MKGCFLSSPSVGIPSGLLMGQMQARKVDAVRASEAAPSSIGAGAELQNLAREN